MTDRQIRKLAADIAKDLFTNGANQTASRLVLMTATGDDLGGWGQSALICRIAAHFTKAMGNKPKGDSK